jgi:hypothetical protein
MFRAASDHEPNIIVHYGGEKISVEEYLNETPPIMYRSDLSAIQGLSSYPLPLVLEPFPNGSFESVDWQATNVEINSEKTPPAEVNVSLQSYEPAALSRNTVDLHSKC